MKRSLLVSEFLSTPWAMMPERITVLNGILRRWSANEPASDEVMATVAQDKSARDSRKQSANQAGGGNIAVLPFYGVVTQRPVENVSGPGALSTQQFTQSLRAALADDSVGQILIDIDSPGGSVYGVGELAEEIYQARSVKPIVAFANSLAASAAYWVGAAASEFYVTPGGEVGSIGVWMAHEDWSEAIAEEGVKPTLISAGKYKVEGNMYQALDADALAFLQSRVDDYYATFTKGVARGRNVSINQVRDGMGQGRVLGASAALAENMVDGVATFDEVIKKMSKNAKPAKASASRLALATRELQLMG